MKHFFSKITLIIGLIVIPFTKIDAVPAGTMCSCQYFDFVVIHRSYTWYTTGYDCAHPSSGLALYDVSSPWEHHSSYIDSQTAANRCSYCGCIEQEMVDHID